MPSTQTAEKPLFTIEYANRMLPLIRRIAEDIQQTHRQLARREDRVQAGRLERHIGVAPMHIEEIEANEATIDELRSQLAEYINELSDLGVILKSVEEGGVSFPAIHSGRLVFLSWKLGEEQLAYWHELDAGFIGRQPIDHTLLGEPFPV